MLLASGTPDMLLISFSTSFPSAGYSNLLTYAFENFTYILSYAQKLIIPSSLFTFSGVNFPRSQYIYSVPNNTPICNVISLLSREMVVASILTCTLAATAPPILI